MQWHHVIMCDRVYLTDGCTHALSTDDCWRMHSRFINWWLSLTLYQRINSRFINWWLFRRMRFKTMNLAHWHRIRWWRQTPTSEGTEKQTTNITTKTKFKPSEWQARFKLRACQWWLAWSSFLLLWCAMVWCGVVLLVSGPSRSFFAWTSTRCPSSAQWKIKRAGRKVWSSNYLQ